MTPEQVAALVSIPAAVAVISTVRLFLKHIEQQRTEDRKERAADRLIWENHLSQSIKVQATTAGLLSDLVTSLKVMKADSDSGMQWARDAIQSLIREIGRSRPDVKD